MTGPPCCACACARDTVMNAHLSSVFPAEWISAPTAVVLASNLFLLSLLASGPSSSLVEIHDLLSLQALQKIPLQSSAALLCPLLLPASAAVGLPRDLGGPELHVLVGCADQIYNLRMVPVAMQVDALVAVGSYEQALRLCGLCDDATFLRGVDVRRLHELQATALWQKGDFEQAAAHFLKASTALSRVLRLVPEIVPASLSPLLEAVRAQHSQPQGAEDKQVRLPVTKHRCASDSPSVSVCRALLVR